MRAAGAHCSGGGACSPRAIARMHRGAPWGGRESAAHRARAGRRAAAGAARMGRARGGRGIVLPWVRAKRKLNAGLTRSVCPQEWPLERGERELAVTQTGRGARHNNTSANPKGARSAADTKRAKRTTGGSSQKALLCSIARAIYPGPTAMPGWARCPPRHALLTRPTQ